MSGLRVFFFIFKVIGVYTITILYSLLIFPVTRNATQNSFKIRRKFESFFFLFTFAPVSFYAPNFLISRDEFQHEFSQNLEIFPTYARPRVPPWMKGFFPLNIEHGCRLFFSTHAHTHFSTVENRVVTLELEQSEWIRGEKERFLRGGGESSILSSH